MYTEEGEDATKSAYVTRLDALKKLGDPIAKRYLESEQRSSAVTELRQTLNNYLTQATSEDEKYSHIEPEKKQEIVEKVATIQKWLDDQLARQAEKPKNVDPVLTCAEIMKRKDEIIYFAVPILSKAKPKLKADAPPSGTETPKSRTDTPDPNAGTQNEGKGPSEMDVD